ncbi:hypothetical protein K461DRAFT_291531 [Myriangium duriaei CBS 260.36]|uniref:Uncharacterized protein n=1 Tax=Myriangium duriaei CBS 260.36 TaxID=1168546 RepID=A0A9P4MHC5_9PEZI|nr:hypothetical protein K461DRAFT_291531 [Myriangium duriaei CBS 260.36]
MNTVQHFVKFLHRFSLNTLADLGTRGVLTDPIAEKHVEAGLLAVARLINPAPWMDAQEVSKHTQSDMSALAAIHNQLERDPALVDELWVANLVLSVMTALTSINGKPLDNQLTVESMTSSQQNKDTRTRTGQLKSQSLKRS